MTAAQHMQALYARRRTNFLTLTDSKPTEAIAEEMCISAGLVKGYKSGRKTINEVRARLIEQLYGLTFGAFDK